MTPTVVEQDRPRLHQSRLFVRVCHLLYAVLIVVVALSLCGWFSRSSFHLELTTHFKLQYALVATFTIPFFVLARTWTRVVLAIACALLNWSLIAPFYTAPDPPPVATGTSLRIVLANVHARNTNFDDLVAELQRAEADVLILQEATPEMWAEIQPLAATYPYSKTALGGVGGLALMSRMPLDWVSVISFDTTPHNGMLARIDAGGTGVTLLTLHPPPPMRARMFYHRNAQLAKAAAIIREFSGARVLVGDLNVTPWSPYFQDLVAQSGLEDAQVGTGIRLTWPTSLPAPLRIPIDHCLTSDEVSVRAVESRSYRGSDHQLLIVDLLVRPSGEARPEVASASHTRLGHVVIDPRRQSTASGSDLGAS